MTWAQPPDDHVFVRTTESKAAAAARIGAGLAVRKRAELLGPLRSCFAADGDVAARGQVRVGAGQRDAEAERVDDRRACGDRTPDRTQRLLNRASWDTLAAMSEVRRFAAAGLEEAARRGRREAAW